MKKFLLVNLGFFLITLILFANYKNTLAVGTGVTYSFVPTNSDQVYVIMASNLSCTTGSPATSNTVTMNVYAPLTANFVVIPSSASFWPVFVGDFILGTNGRNLILSGTTSQITITGNLVIQ